MNQTVQKLLGDLYSPEEAVRSEAVLRVILLLERHFPKERNDPTHSLLLPEEMLRVKLSNDEKDELLTKVRATVFSDSLPLGHRASLAGAMGKTGRLDGFETALIFLRQQCELLDDESVYGIVASIMPSWFPDEQHGSVRALLLKHGTKDCVRALLARNNENLNQAAEFLLKDIEEFIS